MFNIRKIWCEIVFGGEIVSGGETQNNLTGYLELDICIQTESVRVLYLKNPRNMASRLVMGVLLFSLATNSEPNFQTVEMKEAGGGLVLDKENKAGNNDEESNYEEYLRGHYYRSTGG